MGASSRGPSSAMPAFLRAPRMLFIAVTVILVLLGVVMVFSASSVTAVTTGTDMYRPMIKQLAFALVGLVAIAVLNLAP